MIRVAAWVWVSGAIAGVLGGCFSYTPAKSDRLANPEVQVVPLELPTPDVAPLEALQARTPERISRWTLAPGRTLESITDEQARQLAVENRFTVTLNEVIEGTLVRTVRVEDDVLDFASVFSGFVPSGRVLTERSVQSGSWRLTQEEAAHFRKTLDAIWQGKGIVSNPVLDEVAIESGIPFRVPPKAPDQCRGIALHLWALAGNEYERRVAEVLEKDGWLVVDLKPSTNAAPAVSADAVDRILALEAEQRAAGLELPRMEKGESGRAYQARLTNSPAYRRQLQLSKDMLELRNPAVTVCDEGGVAAAAEVFGKRVDAALADNARAAKAVMVLTRRLHPQLASAPVVVIGFSAGAISTPTVAAAVRPDAVVIIGGASNAMGIAMGSELTKGGVRVTCAGRAPSRELVQKLCEAFPGHSKLDAYHTAPMLKSIPVLVVDAGMDTWVPSKYGQELYERLGMPDRLHMALGGHGMLFYFLPGQADRISKWMAKAVLKGP